MGPTCAKKGSRWATPKTKQFFFAEQNFSAEIKPDHKLSELWMIFYFVWCFFAKRVILSHNDCALILIKICPKCFQLTHETMTCIEDNVNHHLPCLALGKLSDKKWNFSWSYPIKKCGLWWLQSWEILKVVLHFCFVLYV